MKKTSSLDNIFTFTDSEKSLDKTPLQFILVMDRSYKPEKKRIWLGTLILGLKSMIKV